MGCSLSSLLIWHIKYRPYVIRIGTDSKLLRFVYFGTAKRHFDKQIELVIGVKIVKSFSSHVKVSKEFSETIKVFLLFIA